MYADLIGYAAGVINMVHLLPQIIKSFKTKSTHDISLSYTIIHAFGLMLWTTYGVIINSYPVMIMHAIETFLAIALVVLKIRNG
jgi:MtN3 and saliva related transmembrane protein